jgi:radical SAM-linked protein
VGRAILKAYQLGCRFDGWDEMFNFQLWMRAFEESGIDPHFYNRDIPLNEVLPWEFIDIGVSKKFLLKERERSYEQVQTYDCKWGDCRGCGIPGNYADIKLAEVPPQVMEDSLLQLTGPAPKAGARFDLSSPSEATPGWDLGLDASALAERQQGGTSDRKEINELSSTRPADGAVGRKGETQQRLPATPFILHYWKEGPARLLSHLNVMQLLERAMVRSGFRLRFTEGFNPHPKFATSPAIPLGMSSRSEYLQFEVHGDLPSDAIARMNECLVEGLAVQSIVPFDSKGKWAITQPLRVTYRALLETGQVNGAGSVLADFFGRVSDLINHLADHYKGNDFYCNSKDHERIVDLWVESHNPLHFGFTLSMNPDTGALLKPRDFLEQTLSCPPELTKKFAIVKDSVSFQ